MECFMDGQIETAVIPQSYCGVFSFGKGTLRVTLLLKGTDKRIQAGDICDTSLDAYSATLVRRIWYRDAVSTEVGISSPLA
jgi:hypothetical protein